MSRNVNCKVLSSKHQLQVSDQNYSVVFSNDEIRGFEKFLSLSSWKIGLQCGWWLLRESYPRGFPIMWPTSKIRSSTGGQISWSDGQNWKAFFQDVSLRGSRSLLCQVKSRLCNPQTNSISGKGSWRFWIWKATVGRRIDWTESTMIN